MSHRGKQVLFDSRRDPPEKLKQVVAGLAVGVVVDLLVARLAAYLVEPEWRQFVALPLAFIVGTYLATRKPPGTASDGE
jgi:hypothetical protein